MVGGDEQAHLPRRPPPQRWWVVILKTVSLSLLMFPSLTGGKWQFDFEPETRPLPTALAREGIPTCSEVQTEYVTQTYAVEGFNATFHCPCVSPDCNCLCQVKPDTPHEIKNNGTQLTLVNVSRGRLGSCVVCYRPEDEGYFLYNITEVAALEHLNFEASSLYDPSLYPNRQCTGNDTWKFCDLILCPPNCTVDTDSYSFSVECPVQGYPPYKSISWDLASWEHLRPCVSFSNGNRTATFRAAKEFTSLQHISLKCIAHNGLDMLTGTRTVNPPSFIDNNDLRDLFAEPLQMQTAGPVELNPFVNASFVCASKSYDVYRVCKVEYTILTLVQRCAASGLAASTTCCTVGRYRRPNCSSGLHAEVLPVEHNTVYVMNVTTSLLGHFQCQVYNDLVKGFQSIGDPIQVVQPQSSIEDTPPSAPNTDTTPSAPHTDTTPSAPHTDTTPSVPNTYMYLFLVSVSMIAVLLAVLAVLAVVVGVVCCRARKKRWSTSGAEGWPFLQRNSTRSSMGSSTGAELGLTTVFVEQRMHREGSRRLEVGQTPICPNPPLRQDYHPLNNGAISLQTIDLDFSSSAVSSQGSIVHTDDPLETAVDELLESTTFSCPATTTTCLQPVAVPPKQEVDPPSLPPVSLEVLVEYIPQMAPRWYLLAVALGVARQAAIIEDNTGRTDKKCTEALSAWIDSGQDVTWSRLLQALRQQDLGAIASGLESKLSALQQPAQCLSNGGSSNGGSANGGSSNGGSANGGSANGGSSNGGSSNGGSSNGGSANGGSANGGANGGSANGGSANGGSSLHQS